MKELKFTKTATQLLYNKRPGDILVTYRAPGMRTTREQNAIHFLIDNGYIKMVNRYQYTENNYGPRPTVPKAVVENHFEVLKRPDWMDK